MNRKAGAMPALLAKQLLTLVLSTLRGLLPVRQVTRRVRPTSAALDFAARAFCTEAPRSSSTASGSISVLSGIVGFMIGIIDPNGKLSEARIAGTELKVWRVYRALVMAGMNEDEVLRTHLGLKPGDVVAVKEYVANSIKSRTHDEFTGRRILPKEHLEHGRYYRGRCRNATIARWNGDEQRFYHWREKFDRVFIETIRYPTDEEEPWWDVYDVVDELTCPKFEIPFDREATFAGQRHDLYEHAAEMWSKVESGLEAGQQP
jgi:uncharacterized protein (DUF433 family)